MDSKSHQSACAPARRPHTGLSVIGLSALIAAGGLTIQGCSTMQPGVAKVQSESNDSMILQQAKDHFMQQNYKQALPLLKYLAKRKNSDAQYALGYMHYYGIGVSRDKQMALTWMRLAAAKNHKRAQIALERHRAMSQPGASTWKGMIYSNA